jgi:polyphosphate kinase
MTQRLRNRELSFLEFNQRILDEAKDETVPLLERVKFISILSANLDEFFMVRVAGLKQRKKSGVIEPGPAGMTPTEQLAAITQRVRQQVAEQEKVLLDELMPALRSQGIELLDIEELSASALEALAKDFASKIFAMLTPLASDPGHPFPIVKNRTLNLAVHLVPEGSYQSAAPLLALVQVPGSLPRFIDVPAEASASSPLPEPVGLRVVFVEALIRKNLHLLFPGMHILECAPFRVIRNWDLPVDQEEQEDLLETLERGLRRRWRMDAVRLEIQGGVSQELETRLRMALHLHPDDVFVQSAPLSLVDLLGILTRVDRIDLRDKVFQPVNTSVFEGYPTMFDRIQAHDTLLHHPYESYEPVIELLESAALDPNVLVIKQTLYRTNRNSPILRSLVKAAENGKQVTALVELKARFDEELNVEWARVLENSGVHVVYGMVGLKTHCKVTLIVRRSEAGLTSFVHLGTGNYNELTASTYSDLSFFTAREDICSDVSRLFNLLTGHSEPPGWRSLIVAPLSLRRKLAELIARETEIARKGMDATIIIKSNALIDPAIIEALYAAAAAGVHVVLLIRGPCTLRVGLPECRDNLEVRVTVDRFLEHARILYFAHSGCEEVFITSTDIMPRNFDRRIEVMVPIEDEAIKARIVHEILAMEMRDNTKAARLQPDGRYLPVPRGDEAPFRAQEAFIRRAKSRSR